VKLSFIAPGKPQQNAFVASFIGKFRKECLNLNCFTSLLEARAVIMNWQLDYNKNRPHSALNYIPPVKFRESYENYVDSKRVSFHVVKNGIGSKGLRVRFGNISLYDPFASISFVSLAFFALKLISLAAFALKYS